MPSRMRMASALSRFCRLRWNLNPSCSSRDSQVVISPTISQSLAAGLLINILSQVLDGAVLAYTAERILNRPHHALPRYSRHYSRHYCRAAPSITRQRGPFVENLRSDRREHPIASKPSVGWPVKAIAELINHGEKLLRHFALKLSRNWSCAEWTYCRRPQNFCRFIRIYSQK